MVSLEWMNSPMDWWHEAYYWEVEEAGHWGCILPQALLVFPFSLLPTYQGVRNSLYQAFTLHDALRRDMSQATMTDTSETEPK